MLARPDREILLPAVLRSLPYGDSRFQLRRLCSTNDLNGARSCFCKQASRHRAPSVLFPNAAHDALPLLPCAGEFVCVFHRALVPRDRGTFALSQLLPASCALQHRSFVGRLSAQRPCRIKAQGEAVSKPPCWLLGAHASSVLRRASCSSNSWRSLLANCVRQDAEHS